MGYYSDLRLCLTKKDYLAIMKKDEKNRNACNYILHEDEATVREYTKNGVDCVFIRRDSFKYYKEFNEVQLLEKYLNEKGIVATIRRELGSDIDAACGQLRKKEVKKC